MSSILYGTKRIAAYLSKDSDAPLSPRQVGYMIERGLLPTFKLGAVICATPEALGEHFAKLAKGGASDGEQ